MTPTAQRIAIAEAHGWRQRTEGMMWSDSLHRAAIAQGSHLESVRRKMRLPMDNGVMLPDWLADLNAMHEAEKTLTIEQAEQYFHHLLRICNPAFCANAGQRAEAFLRTLGKWQDAA